MNMTQDEMIAFLRNPMTDVRRVQEIRRQLDYSNQGYLKDELYRLYIGL